MVMCRSIKTLREPYTEQVTVDVQRPPIEANRNLSPAGQLRDGVLAIRLEIRAGDWHPELENLLDDYCFLFGKESDVDAVKRRAAKGFTTEKG